MSFQIKDFASIAAAVLNHMRGATSKIHDYQPGSVARTLVEGPAVELEELYLQMFLGLRDAIPVATFRSFGFEKLPAATAVGYVSVAAMPALTADLSIPAGTEFRAADGRRYLTTEDHVWPAGSGVIVLPVSHATAGAVGNIAAGAITESSFFGASYSISNQPITNGRDVESDAEREARFAGYVQSLSRGTTEACSYAVRQSSVLDEAGNIAEYVARLGVVEQGGRIRLYIYSSAGAPSSNLLADGQRRIDGERQADGTVVAGYVAAGVRADVLPMAERPISMAISVGMLIGHQLTAAVEQQLLDLYSTALRNAQPGSVLYLGDLTEAMLAAVGVREIVPQDGANIYCEPFEVLVPGTLTITAL